MGRLALVKWEFYENILMIYYSMIIIHEELNKINLNTIYAYFLYFMLTILVVVETNLYVVKYDVDPKLMYLP